MIKLEIVQTGKSYFKPTGEKLYDLTRDNYKKLKIFGITIWERHDIIKDADVVNLTDENKIGFNKKYLKI